MTKVFVNGTFDIIHSGHLYLLSYAKSLGDHLLVALDSDSRIRSKKGNSRPVNNTNTRIHIMSSFKFVDDVNIFNSDDELVRIIRDYSPDIMVVGSDWRDKPVIGSEYAKQLIFFDRIEELSTTNTLNKYLSSIRENNI
jgi:D-beta-D-heptose 7-phosphate kinase/D-beta-D-heptose 1-phosphate adenosyltransferase